MREVHRILGESIGMNGDPKIVMGLASEIRLSPDVGDARALMLVTQCWVNDDRCRGEVFCNVWSAAIMFMRYMLRMRMKKKKTKDEKYGKGHLSCLVWNVDLRLRSLQS